MMASAVLAQTVTYTAVINTGALNVRQGPGVNYGVTTTAFKGQTITLLGRSNDSSWVKIRTSGNQEGWVNASYITPNNVTISNLPVMTTSAQPQPTAPAPVTPGGIAVRSGPGFNYPAVGFINNGSYIDLLGRNGDATWVKISGMGLLGWMNASVIETSQSIINLPFVDGSNVSPTPVPTMPAPAPGTATATITTGALNVRTGPGLGYNVASQVYLGQVVTLNGRNSEGTWVHITTNIAQQGWISAALIQPSVAISSLPVTGAPTLNSIALINTGTANVRSGPGLEYNPVTTVGFRSTVTLLGRNSASNWVKVQLMNGVQGWIHASLLDANVAINTLPVSG
jgi:uncharacterized protein YgiM (DUF1202 family)